MPMLTLGSTDRPEPVLDAARLAAAVSGTVTAIGTIFVLVGWATAESVNNWAVIAGGVVTSIGTLITVALPIITALGARAQVTPLANPVSVEGAPLVAAGPPLPALDRRDIAEALGDLARAESASAVDTALGQVAAHMRYVDHPPTSPLSAVGPWTPATPAATAAEPTPIEAEAAAAAAAGRH